MTRTKQLYIEQLQARTGLSTRYLSDLMRSYFQDATGLTGVGRPKQLEIEFLRKRTGLDSRSWHDLWDDYLTRVGITAGSLEDRIRTFLENKSFDGSYFENTSALVFNGTSDRITITNDAALDVGAQLTLSAWVKATDDGTRRGIFSNLKADGKAGFQLAIENNNKVRFWIGTTAGANIYSTNAVTLGSWIHVAATYDGAAQRIYVNGVLASTATAATGAINTPDQDLTLGDWPASAGAEFNGQLDQMRVWSKALTAAEIELLYRYGYVSQSASLVGEWLLDSPTGYKYADTSGNGNHGTITSVTEAAEVGLSVNGNSISGVFNGTSSRVTTGSAIGISGSQNRSISLWFKAGRGNVTQDIISWGNASGAGRWAIVRLVANQDRISFDTNTYSRTFNAAYNDGQWHHLVMVLDGTTAADVDAYMDGSALTQQAISDGTINTVDTALYIGSNFVPGSYFQGNIDLVRVFDKALSGAEITALMNADTVPSNLVAEFTFDNKAEGTADDSSSSENDGTITGAIYTTTGLPGN